MKRAAEEGVLLEHAVKRIKQGQPENTLKLRWVEDGGREVVVGPFVRGEIFVMNANGSSAGESRQGGVM